MKRKTLISTLTGALLLGSLLVSFAGCNSYNSCQPTTCAQPAPCAVQQCDPCAPFGSNCKPCAMIDCCDYCFQKVAPNSVGINCPFDYCYTFSSKIDAVDIVLTDMIPEGAEFISSSPEAERVGNMLRWKFPHMLTGHVQQLRVTMRATKCGCLEDCMKVSVVPYACTVVCVGQPMLQICKQGPDEICIGDCATFGIQVSNCGNFPAEGVVITDMVPDGMRHSSGKKELRLNVGSLAPGEMTTATVQLMADRGGRFCNVARASGDCGVNSCEAKACVNVVVPAVKIVKSGPCMQYLTKCADYTITVTNTGNTDLHNLTITDAIPPCTCLVDAPGARVDGCNAVWCLACLAQGASATFGLTLTADCPVVATNVATVSGGYCNCAVCESACLDTEWRGYPAVCMTLCDACDPLSVGEATRYNLTITNQGTGPDRNLQLTATLPSQMEFVTAEGAAQFQSSGKTVTFGAVPVLNPGETISYMIKSRAVSVGDARLRVELRSDLLCTPLVEEESTQVFNTCQATSSSCPAPACGPCVGPVCSR